MTPSAVHQERFLSDSLVIAPQWIGDAVMTEPLLRRLAQRGERLAVGALPWVAPVYRKMPQVNEVIEFAFAHGSLQFLARRRLAQELAGRFDTAYVCPNSMKSALLPFLAGIPKRVGYLGEARFGLLTHRLKHPCRGQRGPMVAHYCALSAEADLADERPHLEVDADSVLQTLAPLGLRRNNYCVLAPGAEYGAAKRWPIAHFVELARQLPLSVVVLGSVKEHALGNEIAEPVNAQRAGHGLNLSGRTTLAQALDLIAGAAVTVSNDSGLMHVAAAMGIPQVAIFGSSSPRHTPPLNSKARAMWLGDDPNYQPALDCSPCFERSCRFGHTRCLTDISASSVLAQVRAVCREYAS